MLPDHTGRPMIKEAISLLEVAESDIIVTALAEHERKFQIVRGLKHALGHKIQVILLEEKTKSQSETVYKTLEATDLNEPFLVKDSDNCFKITDIESNDNYVCYDSLNNHSLINPRNKSYLQMEGQGTIINIKEKMVISDTFSVGGYHFTDPAYFRKTYLKLSQLMAVDPKELYLSDVILCMLIDGALFKGNPVTAYQDWGTVQDWKRFLLSKKTYFVALDGYVFERGSEYFEPTFENSEPHAKSIENLKKLTELGHTVILLSIRPQKYAEVTNLRLSELGLGNLTVVYNCPLSKWELITPPYQGIGFRTCDSHEIDPLATDAMERLLE
jgi:hypothetical protein